ncbi:MAG TPA: acyl-CoA dehydrogenase family protein [Actinomycetota bacterium]|nr:acyl-CoA dehydrogenase family protein [Actinomycetota bacterium]
MDFEFDSEQLALRDLARDVFEKESSPARLRDLWEGGPRDSTVWKTLAEVGLLGLTVPEDYGGSGRDEIDLALVLEEAGRAALPEPLLETVAVAAPLLSEAGLDEQRQRWLPAIAAGDAVATVQLEASPFAVDADVADVVIVEQDGELHAVPKGFSFEPVDGEDRARRLFTIDAKTSSETRTNGDTPDTLARCATAAAAFLNGVALRLLDMSVTHVSARQQFGRPVGSFQAVKHKLATVHVLVDSSRSATWYAAYALARKLPDRQRAASVAKAYASDAAAVAGTEALQVHGGIGFTWEHDLHFWLKRGKALEQAYGSAAEHRRRLSAQAWQGDTD